MSAGAIDVRREGAALFLRLDRPEKRNALTRAMLDGLHEALDAAEDEKTGVIVLHGAGDVFCAGADLQTYAEAIDDLEALASFGARAKSLTHRLSRTPSVVVASVDGVAMGGGFELVLSADLVVATDRARFGLPEIRLGLVPGWEGTQRLARHLGPNRAKEAVMLARVLSATELAEAGLVNRVVAPGRLAQETDELVAQLTAQAPLALAAAKKAVTASVEPDPATPGSALETEALLDLFASDDGREGVIAFLDKRAARFTGR